MCSVSISMSTKSYTPEDVAGRECKHVIYIPPKYQGGPDYHYIKEVVHLKDKTVVPNTRVIKDYQRTYAITKEAFRNHTQKKEWEDASKVNFYKSTQGNLVRSIANTMGKPGFTGNLKRISRAPKEPRKQPNGKYAADGQFLYMADILSTSVIKQEEYKSKFPGFNSFNTMACTDTETDMVNRTNKIIMQTVTMKEKVYTAIVAPYLKGIANPKEKLQEMLVQYLPEIVSSRNIKWEIDIVEDETIVVCKVMEKVHEWSPDFLALWNASFDIGKMTSALKSKGIEPKDVFSDPRLPPDLRMFEVKEGNSQKVTASGKKTPLAPHMLWNTVVTPASYYIIDSMCAYKQIRTGRQEERSYGLDFILNKYLKRGKLKFTEADHLKGADWHIFMQKNYPLEYVIYNVFDCVGMEMLDEVTRDLAVAMPNGAAMSDYSKFNSQPRRVCDKLHYFCLERNRVMGTTSDEMEVELDSKVISLRNWIVMLPAHLVADNGLRIILEYPNLISNIRTHIGDLDVSASYPNGGSTYNISRQTTKKELISIDGVSDFNRRMQGINLSGGDSNSVEFCTNIFGMPTMSIWIKAFRDKQDTAIVQEEYKALKNNVATARVEMSVEMMEELATELDREIAEDEDGIDENELD